MRRLTRLMLLLLGAGLALWLVLDFWPLGTRDRVALSALIVIFCAAVGYFQRRNDTGLDFAHTHFAEPDLPPEDFQGAVVLVCGESDAVFSASSWRETRQGWYLPLKTPEHLPLLAQLLSAERPALVGRISVLLAMVPERHLERDALTHSLRAWHRAIVQCGAWLPGIPPVWTGCWLSPPAASCIATERWYTLFPGQSEVQVMEPGAGTVPLAAWSQAREGTNASTQLGTTLWIESFLSWFARHVTDALTQRQGGLPALTLSAWGCCFTPVSGCAGNLWQAQIADVSTLKPAVTTTTDCLPLPDVLLPYLPCDPGVSRKMKTGRLAGMLCGSFLLLAVLGSYVNNQQLIQRVSDHLTLFNRLSGTPPAPKVYAQQQLREDVRLLETWFRSETPVRLSLGLYQGARLIAPLESAIDNWSPPAAAPPPIAEIAVQDPETLSLDSLSLFAVGKSELKAGSANVLINALVGIKAKPGWQIVISGHTDNTGSTALNQRLSLRRAEAVRDWIRDNGNMPARCFSVQGLGDSRPIATNTTADGRAHNRRVEISLLPPAEARRSKA